VTCILTTLVLGGPPLIITKIVQLVEAHKVAVLVRVSVPELCIKFMVEAYEYGL